MTVKPREKQSKALGVLGEEKPSTQQGAPAFRRKRAKGPNPLAMKPKKKMKQVQQQGRGGEEGSEGQHAKRKRARRKARGGTAAAAAV